MTMRDMAKRSVEVASVLLREKSVESSLVERYLLLEEAWKRVEGLPQPLQAAQGLNYVLSKASVPIEPYDLLLGRFDDHVPTAEEEERLAEIWQKNPDRNPVVRGNFGHITIDTAGLVDHGIVYYIRRSRQRWKEMERTEAPEDVICYLKGIGGVFDAIRSYILRYGETAEAAGKTECAEVCRQIADHAPETFRQGLQLILFLYNIYLVYAGQRITCLSLGRLDDILLPLYRQDLEKGILTEEEAGCLIDDFSAKMSLHLGRGEHQMADLDPDYIQTGWSRNPVYESPGYIVIGGYSNYADRQENPLTRLFVRHIHPQLKNPVYVFRWTRQTRPELMKILCEKLRENASILIYNDETVIPAHRHIGVEEQDAVNYSIHPCNWADINGGNVVVGSCGVPMPVLLTNVLRNAPEISSMEELYTRAAEAYRQLLREPFAKYRQQYRRKRPRTYDHLCLSDCFRDGCIENAGNPSDTYVKYPALYVLLRNIGTAADMLSAVDQLVYRKDVCTLRELVEAADRDFDGCPHIWKACREAPKYGTDTSFADEHAVKLMTRLLDVIDEEATNEQGIRDVLTLNVTINDSNHLYNGFKMDATVDGRRKGQPLSENLSGTVGYGKGVTAVLNSVAKLPFDRIHSGALNVKLSKGAVAGDKGVDLLWALITAYLRKGGMQLQVSVTDREELLRARECPEQYRDLLVRITGYSAVFVDMSNVGQEEILRREELC